MTEVSRFWDGSTIGDATAAPYDAATEFSQLLMDMGGSRTSLNSGGVLRGWANELFMSDILTLKSGEAIVYGTMYSNSSDLILPPITPPVSAHRIDRIVLRKDWTTQRIRMTIIPGVEGSGVPAALIQIPGNTWDLPLWQFDIAVGGAYTRIDDREKFPPPRFVPSKGNFPVFGVITVNAGGSMVTITGLPSDAVAAQIMFTFTHKGGSPDPTIVLVASDISATVNECMIHKVSTTYGTGEAVQCLVPIIVPGQVGVDVQVGSVDVAGALIGYWH